MQSAEYNQPNFLMGSEHQYGSADGFNNQLLKSGKNEYIFNGTDNTVDISSTK